jgi:hypothetical protein
MVKKICGAAVLEFGCTKMILQSKISRLILFMQSKLSLEFIDADLS